METPRQRDSGAFWFRATSTNLFVGNAPFSRSTTRSCLGNRWQVLRRAFCMPTIFCEQCGKEVHKAPSRIKRTKHRFCSKDCFYAWHVGANTGNWMGGNIQTECACCGKEISVVRAEKKDKNYCSHQCASLAHRNRAIIVCEQCSKEFEVYRVRANIAKYCSRRCAGLARRSEAFLLVCTNCRKTFEKY